MTREEHIENLKVIASDMPSDKCSDWIESLMAGVKALEQEPRKGYLSIDDVMSVFDDFMCGEVDEDGTETFLEMLKDKAGI